jgi:hypothetical protein
MTIKFGRIYKPDDRDYDYLMAPNPEANKISRRMWGGFDVLNQGDSPMCVGYSGAGYLMASPVRNKADPEELYYGAQKHDGIEGESYEGTTVRGLFRFLHKIGYVSEYRWAFTVKPVLDHILLRGPVVVGTSWYGNMQNPGRNGYCEPGGRDLGGHAYLLIGADRVRKNPDGTTGAFRIVNSWGREWGQNGRAWISFNFMDKLLSDKGESATATEVIKP